MRIEVSSVSAEGSLFEGEEDAAILGLKASDLCTPAGAIRYRLVARRVGARLVVAGRIGLALRADCRRCGRNFSTFVEDSAFLCEYSPAEGQRDVDVTPDLRDALWLRIPLHPLCAESCRGLCPRCGRDLNEGPCGCPPAGGVDAGPWEALDRLGHPADD